MPVIFCPVLEFIEICTKFYSRVQNCARLHSYDPFLKINHFMKLILCLLKMLLAVCGLQKNDFGSVSVWYCKKNCGFRFGFGFYRTMHFSAKRGIAIACRLSVCPSVCDVGGSGSGSHRLEILVTNCTDS